MYIYSVCESEWSTWLKRKRNNDDNDMWKRERVKKKERDCEERGGKESMAEGGEEAQRTALEHNNTERDEY